MVSTVIKSGGGGGALKIAAKADGTTAVFADKSALDSYTTTHPSWANSLPANQAVALGVDNEKVDYAYVRRDGDWVDVTTNFIGSTGAKGETVKITSVDNVRTDKELVTTVALDDGTSATSTATDIAYVKKVAGQDPDAQGDISITPSNIGAYTTAEVDTAISTSADTINARIDSDVATLTSSIDELTETVDENAPYRIYTSLNDIDVELQDLDGINNDQIRINNFIAIITAMGEGSEARLTVGADERISPIDYSRLNINCDVFSRASATAISKRTSEIYIISSSTADAETCTGWVQLTDNSRLKSDAKINQISFDSELKIQTNNEDRLIISSSGIDARNKRIQNIEDAIDEQDATTHLQTERMIDAAFAQAVESSVEKPNYEIDLRNQDASGGYGKDGTKISYFGVSPGNIVPDLTYGKWFFIHEKTDSTIGFHILHKSLFPAEVQDNALAFFELSGTAKGAIGKSNQVSTTFADDAIWDSNGRLIPNTEDANDQTHDEYLDKNGEIVSSFDAAQAATYSFGAMSVVGPTIAYKGYAVYASDDTDTTFIEDPNSDWFVFKGKIGGGTFNVKKLFMAFPRTYSELSYVTETAAEALGIKVSANAQAISELQDEQLAIKNNYVQKTELDDAIDNVADDIIEAELQKRMQSTKIDYDDSIDTIIPVATATYDSLQVLYRINSADGGYKEAGRLDIYRADDSHTYVVDAITRPIGSVPTKFSAYLDTGSIVLKLHNSGAGNGASITYRNNLFSELRTTA